MLEWKEKYYEGEDFSNSSFEGKMEALEFVECSFQNADFSEVEEINKCKFLNCNFSSAALNAVTAKNSAFLGCRFHHAAFFATTFDECKMTGSSFSYTDASLLRIVGGDWSYAELRQLEFDKQKLRQVSFAGADLSGTRFTRCRLDECDFSQAVVDGVSFSKSDIRGSDLGGVDVLAIDMKDTIVDVPQCVIIAEATGAKYKP